MSKSEDRWFEFVETYYRQSSVPLSWVLIGGGQITSQRLAGTPVGMTVLNKREWNRVVGSNVPSRNLPGEVATSRCKERKQNG